MAQSNIDRVIELLSDPEVMKNLGEAVSLWEKSKNTCKREATAKMSDDLVEVIFNIPKKLLDVLEAEKYFGYGKQDFFVIATTRGIGCELTSMPLDDANVIKEKYGFDPGVERFTKKGTLIYP